MAFSEQYNESHTPRFTKTLSFLQKHLKPGSRILDLGPENHLSKLMSESGYIVENTGMIDLDYDFDIVKAKEYDAITAFEILEHLVNPFSALFHAKATYLFASIPLSLWFAKAYWNDDDPFDRHYHEFEDRQFDMLLEKAKWEKKDSQKWISKSDKIGIRPMLRNYTPRYYIVYCERSEKTGTNS